MAKKIKISQIDAFTKQPFSGNPAGVVFYNGLTNEEMQLIAREMNLSETAFISQSDDINYNLRWFTPTTEVGLCGHATIASLHYLKEKKIPLQLSPQGRELVRFKTLSGLIKCFIEGEKYFMQIPLFTMEEYVECKQELISALGIHPSSLNDKIPFIQLSNKNVYICLNDLEALHKIKPDFESLKELSLKKNIGGACIFTTETIDKNNSAHSRYFTPSNGIDEDPVTGSTNGPLLMVLQKLGLIEFSEKETSVTFEQGDVLGRKGRIGVTYYFDKNELYISGNAVTVLKGELIF